MSYVSESGLTDEMEIFAADVLDSIDEHSTADEIAAASDMCESWGICPVCADEIDYCQGHGEIGDPVGFARLRLFGWV